MRPAAPYARLLRRLVDRGDPLIVFLAGVVEALRLRRFLLHLLADLLRFLRVLLRKRGELAAEALHFLGKFRLRARQGTIGRERQQRGGEGKLLHDGKFHLSGCGCAAPSAREKCGARQ